MACAVELKFHGYELLRDIFLSLRFIWGQIPGLRLTGIRSRPGRRLHPLTEDKIRARKLVRLCANQPMQPPLSITPIFHDDVSITITMINICFITNHNRTEVLGSQVFVRFKRLPLENMESKLVILRKKAGLRLRLGVKIQTVVTVSTVTTTVTGVFCL